MSGRWQRTFEVSVPVERVWRAFTEDAARLRSQPAGATPDPNAGVAPLVLEVQPLKLLRWEQSGGTLPDRAEFTVVFESTDRGSRFTVTRCGFGEGEDADVFAESNALGWQAGFMDLVLLLETGVTAAKRHFFGVSKSCTGALCAERDWGLEVLKVLPGTFAERAGLARGDRLVRLAGVGLYSRANLWTLMEEHAPGTPLEVEFIRAGELRRATAPLSSFASPQLRAVGE